jgi:hypothetical protein
MPEVWYRDQRFSAASLDVIAKANRICADYAAQGYDLTLRQLYYQFVARDWIPNRQSEYKRLGSIINDARLAGLLDWYYITDRTRNLQSLPSWSTPESIIEAVANQYRTDRWADQPKRVEVWIEKDALIGVISGVCQRNQVDYFSCRGYTSQSEVWRAAQRLIGYNNAGQQAIVIHLGDHDPSGIDMTRDITDRLFTFGADVEIIRIALNMDQVERYDPPPNPAKLTDSRAAGYIERFGDDSWELDALDPATLDALIEDEILTHRDVDAWDDSTRRMEHEKELLAAVSNRWGDVAAFVGSED